MNQTDRLRLLSELTEQQRNVLRAFCEALEGEIVGPRLYEPIAEKLGMTDGGVKAHMFNICEKLIIDHLHPTQQKIVLFGVYCPLLRESEADLPVPPPGPDKAKPLSEEADSKMIALERAIVPVKTRSLVPIDDQESRSDPTDDGRPWWWLLVGLILGGLLVTAALFALGRLPWAQDTPTAETRLAQSLEDTATPEIREVEVTRENRVVETQIVTRVIEITVEVTTTPLPPPPTPEPTTLEVTDTSTPILPPTETGTPTIAPTPTASHTATPTRVVLNISDPWSDDRVSLTLAGRQFNWRTSCFAISYDFALGATWDFENHSGEAVVLRFSAEDFILTDNKGRNYPCQISTGCHFGTKLISQNVNNADKFRFHLGCGRINTFNKDVDYITLTIRDFSSLGTADWRMEVPK